MSDLQSKIALDFKQATTAKDLKSFLQNFAREALSNLESKVADHFKVKGSFELHLFSSSPQIGAFFNWRTEGPEENFNASIDFEIDKGQWVLAVDPDSGPTKFKNLAYDTSQKGLESTLFKMIVTFVK